jgi:hypothetical protein
MLNSVTNIGSDAFNGCTNLNSVKIGSGVTHIGSSACQNCTKLSNVTIPNSVMSIANGAFQNCSSLTNVLVGSSLASIGSDAFQNCSKLTSLYFASNAPSADASVFANAQKAIAYYLPGTTGWSAFATNTGIATALWLPQMQNSGTSLGVQTNQFGFNLNWASDQTIVVEASTDLLSWQPVQTNILTSGSAYFSDPQWTNYPGRYYRLRSP